MLKKASILMLTFIDMVIIINEFFSIKMNAIKLDKQKLNCFIVEYNSEVYKRIQ